VLNGMLVVCRLDRHVWFLPVVRKRVLARRQLLTIGFDGESLSCYAYRRGYRRIVPDADCSFHNAISVV